MEIPTATIKELRSQSGAGIMECRNALLEAKGDMEKACEILKEQGLAKAQKKESREVRHGLVDAYIHTGGRVGAIIEVNCETDFVARTDEFKKLVHELAMQVTAMSPLCVLEEELPQDSEIEPQTACLLLQPYIKSPDMTIKDLITETIAKIGENIKVSRFSRFELGA